MPIGGTLEGSESKTSPSRKRLQTMLAMGAGAASKAAGTATAARGIEIFYKSKSEQLQATLRQKEQNLRRLEAQRNELNRKVRKLRDELYALQEPGSHVGEVVKK